MNIQSLHKRFNFILNKLDNAEMQKEKFYNDCDKVSFIQAKAINELSKFSKSLKKGKK